MAFRMSVDVVGVVSLLYARLYRSSFSINQMFLIFTSFVEAQAYSAVRYRKGQGRFEDVTRLSPCAYETEL